VWPKTQIEGGGAQGDNQDIGMMTFQNSSLYFHELYDGNRRGQATHSPYVAGFDFGKLAGAGVPAFAGQGQLPAANNMWTIGGNVRDEMEDIIPILVTRNINATSLRRDLPDAAINDPLEFSQQWGTPFGRKGFVIVRKGGGTFAGTARYAKINVVYNNQSFMTTVQGGTQPPFTYLAPDAEQTPQ
jgi:hypothetical protein